MRGIIFDAESVRAILAGEKFQTRRVVKPQPPDDCGRIFGPEWYEPAVVDRYGEEVPGEPVYGIYDEYGYWGTRCPLQPGDVVYVREVWRPGASIVENFDYKFPYGTDSIFYRADADDDYRATNWRSPIHMPEWAARIKLKIVGVRVQRLQEITNGDATAEGVIVGCDSRDWYAERWDEINRKRAPWESNPWVFVYEFRRVQL